MASDTIANLLVSLGLVTKDFTDGLKKATGEVTKSTGKISDDLDKAGKSGNKLGGINDAMGALGLGSISAAAGVGALVAGLKFCVDSAAEAEKIQAQLNAVLKSTGGAAGMTADSVNALASELQGLTTFEDDAIVGAQNILLTFTGIGKNVFPDATKAILDMSTAMGMDLKSAALMVGKALNDPATGISKLSENGVVFTEVQKKMIKEMVAVGDVAGAQRLMLAELNKEFGGSAAAAVDTYSGSMAKLKITLGSIAETIGAALLPALAEAAKALDLLLNWNGKIKVAAEQQAKTMVTAAGSYEEYKAAVERSAKAMNLHVNSAGKLVDGYNRVQSSTVLMTKAEWEAARAEAALVVETKELTSGAIAVVPALDDQGKAIKKVADASAEAVQSYMQLGYYAPSFTDRMKSDAQAAEDNISRIVKAADDYHLAEVESAKVVAKLAEENGIAIAKAAEEAKKLSDEAKKAAAEMEKAAGAAANSYLSLAEAMKGATRIQVAKAAIDELDKIRESGKITAADYQKLATQIELSYGIITKASMKVADNLPRLALALASMPTETAKQLENLGKATEYFYNNIDKASFSWETFDKLFKVPIDAKLIVDATPIDNSTAKWREFSRLIVENPVVASVTADTTSAYAAYGSFVAYVNGHAVNIPFNGGSGSGENVIPPGSGTTQGGGGTVSGGGSGGRGTPSAYAIGGVIAANTLAMVGERGPELFVPSVSGRIIPNLSQPGSAQYAPQAAGVGGITLHYNQYGPVNTPMDREELLNDLARMIKT